LFGLDEALRHLAVGHGAVAVLLVALALGLRHAADPDHLVAVSTLVAGEHDRAARVAARLGAAWGAGHAVTLIGLGLPVLLLRAYLPKALETTAEAAVGMIIVLLAVRVLVNWRRGRFHFHQHEHDGGLHSHVHSHAQDPDHKHVHAVRTPWQAFSIGLAHGTAGSGAVAVLIVAAVPNRTIAALSLLVIAVGSAISMTMLSSVFGRLLTTGIPRRRFAAVVPMFAAIALVFGVWYAFSAVIAY
jgi:ABC-type nickel/cobalt efflux system permease component RcnA